jgi:threonine aldolase
MFCVSKGLGAPIGSLLCGPADVIAEARRQRERMGGAWRQAGVVAAAGIVAIETMVDRLVDDHDRARRLAEAIAERFPESVDPERVRTNVVCARADRLPRDVVGLLAEHGVRVGTIDAATVRFVTHKDVDDDGLDRAVKALGEVSLESLDLGGDRE